MPVAFGFSVGDFITGINLLIDSVKSFSETHGAKADHEELQRELIVLKNTLDGIQALSLDQAQAAQILAVNDAIDACHSCVNGFLQRNSKFKSLSSNPAKQWSLAAFKRGVLGIQWAILKKTEIAKFRAKVERQSNNIHMLLATLQIKKVFDEGKLCAVAEKRDIEHKALTETISAKATELGLDQRRIEKALGD